MFKRLFASILLLFTSTSGAIAGSADQQKPQGATYIALVWIKPGKMPVLQDYESKFRGIMRSRGVKAKPFGIFSVESFNTQWPSDFAYRQPDRIDVVYFEDGDAWPEMSQSEEWLSIKPIRDDALERIVLFKTQNMLDRAHR